MTDWDGIQALEEKAHTLGQLAAQTAGGVIHRPMHLGYVCRAVLDTGYYDTAMGVLNLQHSPVVSVGTSEGEAEVAYYPDFPRTSQLREEGWWNVLRGDFAYRPKPFRPLSDPDESERLGQAVGKQLIEATEKILNATIQMMEETEE